MDLGVSEDTDDSAVLLDALELAGDRGGLALSVLLSVLGESLLLALVPVLVEAALDLVAQVLSPDGGEGSQTAGSLCARISPVNSPHSSPISRTDVANETDDNHWWCVNDSAGLNDLLLVQLRAWTVEVTDDGGHAGLVAY